MKIGSLFDGSGGFPLAGAMCGIEPRWASEVEPYPIAVTRGHFPNSEHLGSVTEIKGAEIEPVDVITFGSPCQDLSVAGKRAGLKHSANGDDETTRSGLFMEAVRIIKEMRRATNGKYPRFAVWENVPGAFSSNKGEDFRIVLEELIKICEPQAAEVPSPDKSGWPYADLYMGNGWSLAYRVFDAQYWGVPQRRRRIYLVLDLGGQSAGKVLFERKSLRGYFTESGSPWQGAAGHAQIRSGSHDSEKSRSASESGIAATLYATYGTKWNGNAGAYSGENFILEPQPGMKQQTFIIDNIGGQSEYSKESPVNGTLRSGKQGAVSYCIQGNCIDRADTANCNGKGWKEDVCYTLNTIDRPAVCYDARGNGDGTIAPTITGDHNGHISDYTAVLCMAHGQGGAEVTEEKSPCLTCNHEQPIVFDKEVYNSGTNATGGHYISEGGAAPAIRTHHPPGICNEYIVRRLTPTECARLQGFPDRWGDIPQKDNFTDEEYSFWLDVRNTYSTINSKAAKEYTRAQMLTWYNKLHSDSSEYKMWGNGIALPNALYVMQGIAEVITNG